LIDSIFHPLFKRSPRFVLTDGLLHLVVERHVRESLLKFVYFNTPVLLKQVRKGVVVGANPNERTRRQRRRR
jgi:hypothetical protein